LVSFEFSRLKALFQAFEGKRIAVVGDLMLDRYYWGSVMRISPEAPVPVVEVDEESTRLGGAANVANNIASLGGVPFLVGVAGADDGGILLRKTIEGQGFSSDGVVTDPSRPTTVKTRVIAHSQHVVRIDQEVKTDVDVGIQKRILEVLASHMSQIDGVILEDYNKGVLTQHLIQGAIELAMRHQKIITVDPKFHNFFEYRQATVFKPNRKETEEALGVRLSAQQDVEKAGKTLLQRLSAENVLMTLGEKGMALFERSGSVSFVPTHARHVADVSGAGDTVISTLTVALAAGAAVKEAAALANVAGGIVCGEVGIVPIQKQDLFEAVYQSDDHKAS
jgi:rfaE bifunctional protein kinase chain/domain